MAKRKTLPRVALVGRPNVGKSSLFNRLLGRREAIVHDRPGVTRDRIERRVRIEGREAILLDTGGLVPSADEDLLQVVTRQALFAAREATVLVFVIDGRSGVTPLDESVAALLREADVPVVVAVNKIDVPALVDHSNEAWRLGLGEPIPVSAEHNLGFDEFLSRVAAHLPETEEETEPDDPHRLPDPEDELLLAVVGRPNVGKSSLVNRLAGEERVTVSPLPGTTRDAVDVALIRDGRRFRLVDTAGLRKRSRVAERDEAIGILFTRRRLERSHLAVLVLDAVMGPTSQDVAIAGEIAKARRPLILVLNKWDRIEDPEAAVERIDDALETRLGFVRYAPRLTVSALTGQRVFKVLDTALDVARAAGRRLKTSELNRFLDRVVRRHTAEGGSAPKMLYITQTGVLPPRFIIFHRERAQMTPQLRRFLENRLREAFDLGPTPVVIDFKPAPRRRSADGRGE
ncbi:MAG: ribosome biogenesis GTPase Der [Acidobacteriota bacterium]|nr:ribosome biogenesis GTPase Der [Acidobacteriota bacterium]